MTRFKKSKRHAKKVADSDFAIPRRTGRRAIGDMDELLSRDQLQGMESRKIGDFSQAGGYHSARPTISDEFQPTAAQPDAASLLNKTLPTDLSSVTAPPVTRRKPRMRLRKRLAWGATFISAVIVGTGIFLFTKGYLNLHRVFGGTKNGISATCPINALNKEGDCRINLVLMGIGGEGHDGPDLTDTILLASIDPINHKAALLSIPRDLWVNPNGYSPMKINALYESGKWKYLGTQSSSNKDPKAVQAGFDLVNQNVTQITGLAVQGDILVDFQAFQQMVDTLGGINVYVPTTLYDPTVAWENHYNPIIARAGNQFFDGKKALLYVRSRETTSDFSRSERQRSVIVAMKDKALSLGTYSNPAKLSSLSDEFANDVHTNLTVHDAQTLYSIGNQIPDSNIQSVGLADKPNNFVKSTTINTTTQGLQSIVVPTAGFYSYTAIQNFVRGTFRDGQLAKENANIMILNASSQPNLATQESTILKSYGYNVGTIDDNYAQKSATTKLIDLTKGHDPFTKNYLQKRLGVSASGKLSDSSIQVGDANFVIILGDDATINSSN